MELVQRRAAAEGEPTGQVGNSEDLDQCSTDHEILLDLRVDRPRRVGAPTRDVVPRDHSSGSTSTFTMSFQVASRLAPALLAARRRGV